MMSGNHVTHQELEKRLEAYEKLGGGQMAAGLIEDKLKKYVREQVSLTQTQITSLVEERASQLFQKVDLHVRKCVDNMGSQINESTQKTISALTEKAKRDLMTDLGLHVKAKMDELRVSIATSQKSFEAALEKVFWSKLDSFQSQIRTEINDFEKMVIEKSNGIAAGAVEDVREGVSVKARTMMSEHFFKIEKLVEDLRTDLTSQMSKKLVDKNAIEARIREIESELTKKAQSVIDFNINQARANMENAAKAEVKLGIQNAASEIISGIS